MTQQLIATQTRAGAEPPSGVVMPPAPPGESSPEAVQKTRAVADAMIELGENADPKRVAEAIKAKLASFLKPARWTQSRRPCGNTPRYHRAPISLRRKMPEGIHQSLLLKANPWTHQPKSRAKSDCERRHSFAQPRTESNNP